MHLYAAPKSHRPLPELCAVSKIDTPAGSALGVHLNDSPAGSLRVHLNVECPLCLYCIPINPVVLAHFITLPW